MKLTILGSGAALFNPKRVASGHLLQTGENLILLDAGPGVLRQFNKAGADYFDLTHIFISHTHADHLSDLMPIIVSIFVRTLALGGSAVRKKPLTIIGPPGFKKVYRFLRKAMMPEKEPFKIQVFEMASSRKKFDNFKLESNITRHVEYWKSVSYKIQAEGKTLVYSGDTGFCPEIIDFCRGADVLLLEGTVPIAWEMPKGHLNPQFAADIAQLSGAKTLILSHLYDIDTPSEIKSKVAKIFHGKIIIAKDLEKINI